MKKIINLPEIKKTDNALQWNGLTESHLALAISELSQEINTPLLVITRTAHDAERLYHDIRFFNGDKIPVTIFPDWETLPYDHFSPHQDIVSQRLSLLSKLPQTTTQGVFLASASTLMYRLMPKGYLLAQGFSIRCGEKIDIIQMRDQLIELGYRHTNQVMEHGELSLRGAIIDLFPMGSRHPFRIEFFDNEVDTIRQFDPDNQRSTEKLTEVNLLPAHEYTLNKEGIERFRQNWREKFDSRTDSATIYQQISKAEPIAGIEYYLPLFFEKTSTFFDYLPSKTLCLLNNIQDPIDNFWNEIQSRYENLRHDIHRPLCPPKDLFLPPNEFNAALKNFKKIQLTQNEKQAHFNFNKNTQPDLSIDHRSKQPLNKLQTYLTDCQKRILFCVESSGRRETLCDLLKSINIKPCHYKAWEDFLKNSDSIGITVSPLEKGMELDDFAIITEAQLFGEQVKQRRQRSQSSVNPELMIRNLTELSINAPVVHIDHGVGRYRGLETLTTGDVTAEYLTLEYANHDKIYVPISSLHLISRYSGADSENAPLQKLGSKQWEKIKKKTAEKIRDTAAELLDIYGRRLANLGYAFKFEEASYQQFADKFPFEETPDQSRAIADVLKDMRSKQCMDRLICGDVGFGKTEIAMRAAFIAAMNSKQVAVLVPTTLLATQHLQNFQDRFSDWPIKIAGLSRMTTAQDQRKTIEGLEKGTVDIVIGTHKLLSETIKFKDLGLLVIDEEQRFGVRQKERITSFRTHIDILTLTATPIPRTLNMALAGTRDLSVVATPPPKRLSVKTFVHEEDKGLVREAILREIMRGGQIYFLHNKVATIQAQAEKLSKLVPEARIAIAHGQMSERQLEKVMSDFYHQRFNLLLCSTIIESGIDIPTANTIIINRADRFGLSQLHQLRGRVGRSHHQAYAYLLTPPENAITKDATKRLNAIATLGDLGIGFNLASHDLEIRGAGELLGDEQSGQIHEVGFTLYMELLEEAVKAIKAGKEPQLEKPLHSTTEVDLGISALLPNDYVGDVGIRLTLYKRLANCKTEDEIQEIKAELVDRFGLLPEAAQNLLTATHIKLKAQGLGIRKIETSSKFGYLHFEEKPAIQPEKLIALIQKNSRKYQLLGMEKLRFTLETQQPIADQISQLFKNLS